MGVATGCGFKEIYRFPHTTYPYSSCIYLYFFAAASLLFCSFKKMFFVLYINDLCTFHFTQTCKKSLASVSMLCKLINI